MDSILTWYRDGGPFILPLIVTGVAGLALLVERVAHIAVRSRIHARPFMERVISLVRAGKRDEALALCVEHQAALPDVGIVILRNENADPEALYHVAHAAALAVLPTLTRRIQWLTALAWISVMLGALGSLANLHDALGRPGATMASAVPYAIRPLAVGLLTAVPLVAGHAWLAATAEKLSGQLEEFSVRLINALSDVPDVRLGHRE